MHVGYSPFGEEEHTNTFPMVDGLIELPCSLNVHIFPFRIFFYDGVSLPLGERTSPGASRNAIISTQLRAPTFSQRCLMCSRTVFSPTTSSCAIAGLFMPLQIKV